MDQLATLLAIEDIKRLKARYFRAVDSKDWALMATVLAEDFVGDFRGANVDSRTGKEAVPEITSEVMSGSAATIAVMAAAAERLTTVHHASVPEIEITGEATATGIWPMFDLLRDKAGGELVGYGHYHETYEKVAGAWRIKTSRLTRLILDNSIG